MSEVKQTWTVNVPIPITFTQDDLESILIGAMEGGSNYWIGKNQVTHPLYTELKEFSQAKGEHMAYSEYAFDALLHGGSFYVEDDKGDNKGTLNLESLVGGTTRLLRLRVKQGRIEMFEGDFDAGQLDATDSDGILQYALFKEWIFG